MHLATPQDVFCEIMARLSMPKEHKLLIRYPTRHLSLNHSRNQFPTYEYIIILECKAKLFRIETLRKSSNPEDPDKTYTYGQPGFQYGLKRMFKLSIKRKRDTRHARQALNLGDNAEAIGLQPDAMMTRNVPILRNDFTSCRNFLFNSA
jgi:hypothetical protein